MDKHVLYVNSHCDTVAGDSNLTDVFSQNWHFWGFSYHKSHGFNSENIMPAL